MKDANEKNTIDALKAGPGRPRLYESTAEKQKAYRERRAANTIDYTVLCDMTKRQIQSYILQLPRKTYPRETLIIKAWGAYELWVRLTAMHHEQHDEDVLRELLASMED